MLYVWKHVPTGLKIEVERKMADSDTPPLEEELDEKGLIEQEFKDMKNWKKVVTGGSFSRGFGMKGFWITLMAVGLLGCGKNTVHTKAIYKTAECTVRPLQGNALVVCPDGTHILVKSKLVKTKSTKKKVFLKPVIQLTECK